MPSKETNLEFWKGTGQAEGWVRLRGGVWNHQQWCAFLKGLEKLSYWPMDPDQVGVFIEQVRDAYIEERNLQTWIETCHPSLWIIEHGYAWNDEQWLSLLNEFHTTPYWPMDPDQIGLTLSQERDALSAINIEERQVWTKIHAGAYMVSKVYHDHAVLQSITDRHQEIRADIVQLANRRQTLRGLVPTRGFGICNYENAR